MPANPSKTAHELGRWYDVLYARYGSQGWWPARTRFEVIIGAILTQNTSWRNVEKALVALRQKRLLEPKKLSAVSCQRLARLIRPSGYYNIKALRIKAFLDLLNRHYRGSLRRMSGEELLPLRQNLLTVKGIGPETADSILLYAFGKAMFVVDAYTRRILLRHRFIQADASYECVQKLFTEHLPADSRLYNEYHALLVHLAKECCVKQNPRCAQCPLRDEP